MAFADLVRRVMDQAPGCPDPVAAEHVRAAVADFCQRTRCWRHVTTSTIPDAASAGRFTLTIPDAGYAAGDVAEVTAARVWEIEAAWLDDVELVPATYGDLDPTDIAGEGPGRFITAIDGRGQVAIVPRQAGVLRANLFLTPAQDKGCTSLSPVAPEWMAARHGTALVSGALRSLLLVPGKSWTNPGIAVAHDGVFERACNANFAVAVRGRQRAPVRNRPRFF